MCKSVAEGGQRCAAHTREKYRKMTPADGAAFDDAAASYASTGEGRDILAEQAAAASSVQDYELEARLKNAIERGQAQREANAETAAVIAGKPNPADARGTWWRDGDMREYGDGHSEPMGGSYADERAAEAEKIVGLFAVSSDLDGLRQQHGVSHVVDEDGQVTFSSDRISDGQKIVNLLAARTNLSELHTHHGVDYLVDEAGQVTFFIEED